MRPDLNQKNMEHTFMEVFIRNRNIKADNEEQQKWLVEARPGGSSVNESDLLLVEQNMERKILRKRAVIKL